MAGRRPGVAGAEGVRGSGPEYNWLSGYVLERCLAFILSAGGSIRRF